MRVNVDVILQPGKPISGYFSLINCTFIRRYIFIYFAHRFRHLFSVRELNEEDFSDEFFPVFSERAIVEASAEFFSVQIFAAKLHKRARIFP